MLSGFSRSGCYVCLRHEADIPRCPLFVCFWGKAEQALFAPTKTPREIVGKIGADTNTVLAEPAIRAKLAEMGYVAAGSSPEELGKLLSSEIARWSALIKSVGITLD